MINNVNFIIRTDILPSQLTLPSDNWRENPNINSDELAKSIASVGLIQPPVIAIYKNPSKDNGMVVIDGNRRTYACQLLEKGYRTAINDTPVILELPTNWRVAVLEKPAEELTQDDIDKIRLHSTEQHTHFSRIAIRSQIWQEARSWSLERGLSLIKTRANKTLNEELIKHLERRFQLERVDVLKWMREFKSYRKYSEEVELPLHEGLIKSTLAAALSTGVKSKDVPKLLEIIKEQKDRGVHEGQLYTVLGHAKKNSKNSNVSVVEDFARKAKRISIKKNINIDFPISVFSKLDDERRKRKTTWNELMIPVIVKNIDLFLKQGEKDD